MVPRVVHHTAARRRRLKPRTVARTRAAVCLILVVAASARAVAQPAESKQPSSQQPPPAFTEAVEVVGATPIHGLGVDRDKIPSNVQTATADALSRTGADSVSEGLNRAVPSVHVNEATTNPFQPDLHFRGFVGSPLLGLPQGLAVYQNGVRLNEPFGDTVNWDLLPANAVASINLMPGSNPLFGLNALGGAISVQTKTGFSHAGHGAAVSGGSFGRYQIAAESGGNNGRLGYFVAGTALAEDGWRDFSPSRLRQLFGDFEWRAGSTMVNGTLTAAANRLIGNGASPIELLEENRSAIFTYPDETGTRMALLTARARHTAGPAVSFDAMLFYRRASTDTFNGDDSDYDGCEREEFEGLLCSEEGEGGPVEDQFGSFIRAGADDDLDGTNNTSHRLSTGWGGAFQATVLKRLAGRANHFVTGVSIDGGRTGYRADTEIARLTAERGTLGTGLFDVDASVRLRTNVRHLGVYAADFFTAAPRLTLMGAVRFNYSNVSLRDQAGTALDGDHAFSRVNPAAGLTYAFTRHATVYGSFSMSSRVPAPSELSCADPEDPCRLPNAFVADPPLEGVVARTWEAGLRGRTSTVSWNASLFSTMATDDILFISSGPLTNSGHFENVGDTLRQGLELGASGAVGGLRWGAAYSLVGARFQTPLTLSSANHPEEKDGEIEVEAGSRMPGVPQHNLKASVTSTMGRLMLGGNVLRTSSEYLRGDEANLLPAIDGFTVVSLLASYSVTANVALTVRLTNLLDAAYSTFGLLGEPDEVLGDDYGDPRFLSPGAPRAAWIGLRFSFG